MTIRQVLFVALLIAGVPGPAAAAPKAAGARPGPRPAAPAHAGTVPGAARGAAPRRLDDIHIEGEIPVPQVLFVTVHDPMRMREFQHGRYRRTSRKLGEGTAVPSWIVVTGTRPAQDKGSSR